MQPVACGGLRDLHAQNHGIAAHDHAQFWSSAHQFLHGCRADAESVSGNLHDLAHRARSQTHRQRSARKTLAADYAYLDGPSILSGHYQRYHSTVWKVRVLDVLTRLMQVQVVWQVEEFKSSPDQFEFVVRKRHKEIISDWVPVRAGSLCLERLQNAVLAHLHPSFIRETL
jgi:hypothetical protein